MLEKLCGTYIITLEVFYPYTPPIHNLGNVCTERFSICENISYNECGSEGSKIPGAVKDGLCEEVH